MPRDHARLTVKLWDDKEFQQLTPEAQATYMMLLCNDSISWCGVLDYIPKRLVRFSAHMDKARLAAAIGELSARRFVLVDDEQDELLIRSYVRHDGILKMPNVAKAMVRAIERVESAYLRECVVKELARAYREDPSAKGWQGVRDESPELFQEVCDEPLAEPTVEPLSEPFPQGMTNSLSPFPLPPSPHQEETAAQAQPAPPLKTRGTRIPETFAVTGDMMGWAREHLRGTGWRESDVIASTAKFRDYWTAKAGRDGVKLDWVATWRNWIRRDAENGPRPAAAAAGPALRQSHATRLVASVTAPGGLMDRAIQRDVAAGRIADPNAPTQPTLEIGPA